MLIYLERGTPLLWERKGDFPSKTETKAFNFPHVLVPVFPQKKSCLLPRVIAGVLPALFKNVVSLISVCSLVSGKTRNDEEKG